jgi:hypothetical protein
MEAQIQIHRSPPIVNAGYGIQIVHVGARPVLRCNIAVAVVDVQVRRAGPSDVTTIERIVHEAFGKYVARPKLRGV